MLPPSSSSASASRRSTVCGLQPAIGQLLDPVGQPAFEEAAIVGRRRGVEELLPLLPQLWRRHAPESRDLHQDTVLFCHAILRLGVSA